MNIEQQYIEISEEEAGNRMGDMFTSIMTQKDFDESVIQTYCVVQNGEIYFEETDQALQAKDAIEEWSREFNVNALDQNLEEPVPVIQLDDVNFFEPLKAVTFQMFSETEKGIRQQLSIFLDFCKTLPGIKKFDAPILQTIDPVTWERK